MKTWEEMTESEQEEMLSPTREQMTWDGTTVRVPKIKNAKEWKLYLLPYMEMKYLEAMSWSHEAAALGYAVSSCSEIIDDALLEHYKSLLEQCKLLLEDSVEVSTTLSHSLRHKEAQRRWGGHKRHVNTSLVRLIALREWEAKSESERSRRGAKTLFAHWVQDTLHDPKGDPIPKDPKTVFAWISEWEKEAQ